MLCKTPQIIIMIDRLDIRISILIMLQQFPELADKVGDRVDSSSETGVDSNLYSVSEKENNEK
jgi:hypothetical protein